LEGSCPAAGVRAREEVGLAPCVAGFTTLAGEVDADGVRARDLGGLDGEHECFTPHHPSHALQSFEFAPSVVGAAAVFGEGDGELDIAR